MSKKLIAFALAGLFAFSAGSFKADAISDGIVCFNIDLKQGMTSPEVSTLQTELKSDPTVYPEGLVTGYFGPLTLKAVKAFQAKYGIITTGYVGPLTRGKLTELYCPVTTGLPAGCTSTAGFSPTTGLSCATVTGLPAGCTSTAGFSPTTGLSCTSVVSYPTGCTSAVGFSPTTGLSCAGTVVTYPAGCTSAVGFSPTTGLSCAGTTVGPTEGSITVSYDAIPVNNLAVNRGESKDVMGIKVKAIGSDMTITRLFLDINTRIWLSADSVSLLDGSTVLATLPLSASTVTEITAGSAYQLQFNGLNFVVPVGTTKVLTVKVSRPVATSANASVTVAATSALRAVDSLGITDTYVLTARTWNMANAVGSTGTLTATLNSGSPAIGSVSGLSTTPGVLTPVKLMDFDLKATSGAVNITDISGTSTSSGIAEEDMASLELRDGSTVLSSVVVTSADTFDFSSLNIDVAADTTKTLSIWAQVNYIDTNYVVEGDAIYVVVNNVDGTSGTAFTDASITPTVTGNAQYLYQYAPTVTFTGASIPVVSFVADTGTPQQMTGTLTFSVKANGQDEYLTATPATGTKGILLAQQVANGTPATTTYTFSQLDTTSADAVNTSGVFKIPNGSTKTFVTSYKITVAGADGYNGAKLSQLWLTDDTTGITSAIDYAYALPSAIGQQAYITK